MNRIKSLREKSQITQNELANRLGVKQSTVAMWETGKNMPRTQLLSKLSETLGCSVDELLGIEKTPSVED